MSELESVLEQRLSELDLDIETADDFRWPTGLAWTGGVVRLRRSGSDRNYRAVVGVDLTFTGVSEQVDLGLPLLVMTTQVAARTADRFRRSGIQYIDTAGNAWIEFGDTLIDIRGRTLPGVRRTAGRQRESLLSPRRAQVVFALLAWPHLWRAPTREVSRAAGVSVGLAHGALQSLEGQGYARDVSPGRLSLLDVWTAAYPTGLGPRLALAAFHGDPTSLERVAEAEDVLVSGAAAIADVVSAPTMSVYVSHLDPRLPIVNRWRVDGEPNIFVRRKFWETPISERPAAEPGVAPWPLVYADLIGTGDPRLLSMAEKWRDTHVIA